MLVGRSPIRLYDGLILPNGTRIPFPSKVSKKVQVVDITPRNHPVYSSYGSKRLIAKEFIPKHHFIGSHGGQIFFVGDNEWNPYQITPKDIEDYYMDTEIGGNEMRYINPANSVNGGKANVKFYRSDDRLRGYYTTDVYAIKNIQPGEEILVSRGAEYRNYIVT